jgi:hypothetical protein
VSKAAAGKTIALFAVPGAFTPTCSAKHVPGYLQHVRGAEGGRGGRDLVPVSVNDAFVMGAWAREQKTAGQRSACWPTVRRVHQANRTYAGPAPAEGPGAAQQPLLDAGQGRQGGGTLNVEAPGKFEVSDAATILAQAKG